MKRLNILALCLLVGPLSLVDAGSAWSATMARPALAKDAQAATKAGTAAASVPKRARQAAKKIPPPKNLARSPVAPAVAPVGVAQAVAPVAPPVFMAPAWSVPPPAPVVYAPSSNPYLAYRQAALRPPAPLPSPPVTLPAMPHQAVPATRTAWPSPLAAPAHAPVVPQNKSEQAAASLPTDHPVARHFSGFQFISPVLPPRDQSILPTFRKVYPTGDKPLVVVTFKCPTELIGITTLPTMALHGLVDLGMEAMNASNMLSFNLQRVCQ